MLKRSSTEGHDWLKWLPGLLIGAVYFVLYVRNLPPSIVLDDPAELTVLSWGLGLAHSIGYPLYIFTGHLFIRLLPFGDVAFRLSFASAFFSFVSLVLLYCLAYSVAQGPRAARAVGASAAALALGFSPTFWGISIVSEMYSFQIFLSLVVILLALRWARKGGSSIFLAALVYGMMLGNHSSAIGLFPGLVLLISSDTEKNRRKTLRLVTWLCCMLLGFLAGYVFPFWLLWMRHLDYDFLRKVILNNPELYPRWTLDPDSFWSALRFCAGNGQFSGVMTQTYLAPLIQAGLIPLRMLVEFSPLAAAAALAGLFRGIPDRRINRVFIVFILCVYLCSAFPLWKVPVYQLNATVILSVYLGALAARAAAGFMQAAAPASPWRRPVIVFAVGMLLLLNLGVANHFLGSALAKAALQSSACVPVLRNPRNFISDLLSPMIGPRPDRSEDTGALTACRTMLNKFPHGSVVFALWNWLYPLEYVARVERGLSSLTFLELFPKSALDEMQRNRSFRRSLLRRKGAPVYFVGTVPDGLAQSVREVVPSLCWELISAQSRIGSLPRDQDFSVPKNKE